MSDPDERSRGGVDFVGDVHGQHEALVELGRKLGYDVDAGWAHAEDRLLVFLGDLVDRGANSLGVAELVVDLVDRDSAVCLMGNHEYNLVAYALGLAKPKHSNRRTIADLEDRPKRWRPIIEAFERFPLAIELPGLRAIHAVWHLECLARVEEALCEAKHDDVPGRGALERVGGRIRLGSPFHEEGLAPGLPEDVVPPGSDRAHEVLIKGFEAPAPEPFVDNDGKERTLVRVTWWNDPGRIVATDALTVFGHYWNLPPVRGLHDAFVPPYPSGHPLLRAWQIAVAPAVPKSGSARVPDEAGFVCVDYNGVADAGAGACVGAFRWPERTVVWARTAAGDRDA